MGKKKVQNNDQVRSSTTTSISSSGAGHPKRINFAERQARNPLLQNEKVSGTKLTKDSFGFRMSHEPVGAPAPETSGLRAPVAFTPAWQAPGPPEDLLGPSPPATRAPPLPPPPPPGPQPRSASYDQDYPSLLGPRAGRPASPPRARPGPPAKPPPAPAPPPRALPPADPTSPAGGPAPGSPFLLTCTLTDDLSRHLTGTLPPALPSPSAPPHAPPFTILTVPGSKYQPPTLRIPKPPAPLPLSPRTAQAPVSGLGAGMVEREQPSKATIGPPGEATSSGGAGPTMSALLMLKLAGNSAPRIVPKGPSPGGPAPLLGPFPPPPALEPFRPHAPTLPSPPGPSPPPPPLPLGTPPALPSLFLPMPPMPAPPGARPPFLAPPTPFPTEGGRPSTMNPNAPPFRPTGDAPPPHPPLDAEGRWEDDAPWARDLYPPGLAPPRPWVGFNPDALPFVSHSHHPGPPAGPLQALAPPLGAHDPLAFLPAGHGYPIEPPPGPRKSKSLLPDSAPAVRPMRPPGLHLEEHPPQPDRPRRGRRQACLVCGEEATLACSGCAQLRRRLGVNLRAFFCSTEHQAQAWKQHHEAVHLQYALLPRRVPGGHGASASSLCGSDGTSAGSSEAGGEGEGLTGHSEDSSPGPSEDPCGPQAPPSEEGEDLPFAESELESLGNSILNDDVLHDRGRGAAGGWAAQGGGAA